MVSSGESWVIGGYPLVNVTFCSAMENHNFSWVNQPISTYSMAIFNSYVKLPEGKG